MNLIFLEKAWDDYLYLLGIRVDHSRDRIYSAPTDYFLNH